MGPTLAPHTVTETDAPAEALPRRAAALGNAIRDAAGHRFRQTPFKAGWLRSTAEGFPA